jgi:hypothetical protein
MPIARLLVAGLLLAALAESGCAVTSTRSAPEPFTETMRRTPRLIEFGWDEPDPAFMRRHVTEMEKTVFDGTVFHLSHDFLWECWGKRAFTEAELRGAIDDLQSTPFTRFTHNFLRFNVTPGNVDWFDDFSVILGNAALAARIARTGKAAGILFDIEQYNTPLFDYPKARDAASKSFDEYAAQVRRRGQEVMDAFQTAYPDLTVFLTFAYSLPYREAGGDVARLPHVRYGLLKPFVDGLFDAARGRVRIVEGYEVSYAYKEPRQFDEAATSMRETILPWLGHREKYRAHLSLAFGLWMDYAWRSRGWNTTDVSRNYFTPEEFEASVRKALSLADDYVWVYTETPRWWTADGGRPAKLPREYDQALRRAAGRD